MSWRAPDITVCPLQGHTAHKLLLQAPNSNGTQGAYIENSCLPPTMPRSLETLGASRSQAIKGCHSLGWEFEPLFQQCIWGETPPKNRHLFIKMCVFSLTCLNFSHLQSTLHLMQGTYWDVFPLLKTSFELVNFGAFYCFCHFLFHLFHISKMFPFEDFFSSGETKKSCSGWDWVNRGAG